MSLIFFRKFTFFGILFFTLIAHGYASTSSLIQISQPRARAAQKGGNSAVFLDIKGINDRLIQVTCEDCTTVELHTHLTEIEEAQEGHKIEVKRMRPVPFIQITKDAVTELKPGGLHIMLLDLKKPLAEGETVKLTLFFEKSPPVEVIAPVKKSCGCH